MRSQCSRARTLEFSAALEDTLTRINTDSDLTVHIAGLNAASAACFLWNNTLSSVVKHARIAIPQAQAPSEWRSASVPAGNIRTLQDTHTHTHTLNNDKCLYQTSSYSKSGNIIWINEYSYLVLFSIGGSYIETKLHSYFMCWSHRVLKVQYCRFQGF